MIMKYNNISEYLYINVRNVPVTALLPVFRFPYLKNQINDLFSESKYSSSTMTQFGCLSGPSA